VPSATNQICQTPPWTPAQVFCIMVWMKVIDAVSTADVICDISLVKLFLPH
jgi:hypothetical protein